MCAESAVRCESAVCKKKFTPISVFAFRHFRHLERNYRRHLVLDLKPYGRRAHARARARATRKRGAQRAQHSAARSSELTRSSAGERWARRVGRRAPGARRTDGDDSTYYYPLATTAENRLGRPAAKGQYPLPLPTPYLLLVPAPGFAPWCPSRAPRRSPVNDRSEASVPMATV